MYLNGGALHLLEIVFVRNYSGSIVYWSRYVTLGLLGCSRKYRESHKEPDVHDSYNASCSTPSQSTHPLAMRSRMPITPETDG